jgi:hypothetical protein
VLLSVLMDSYSVHGRKVPFRIVLVRSYGQPTAVAGGKLRSLFLYSSV